MAILTPDQALQSYALSHGIDPGQLTGRAIGARVALAFGDTCGKIGILIAMAAVIGKCLLESGAAEKIVRSLLKITGEERAPVSFLGSSFFLAIPVFFDTVFYLMIPLAKAMAAKIGRNYLLLVLCIAAGGVMAHSLVPPTPGPLFLVVELDIPMGMMIVSGLIVGLFTIVAGFWFAKWADAKWPIPLRDSPEAPLEEIRKLAAREVGALPGLLVSTLPILLPVGLITAKAALETFAPGAIDSPSLLLRLLVQLIDFGGEKNLALILGALIAILLLVSRPDREGSIKKSVQDALLSGGLIILITSAGGAFGAMLQQTDISANIADLTQGYQMALIPLAFLITAIVRTAQGSATVAMITAAGILSGMSTEAQLPYHVVYIGLAIACGSKLIPWMNDSGFWIVCKMSNLTEKEALKTFSPLLTIMGLTGLIVILIGAKLFPLI